MNSAYGQPPFYERAIQPVECLTVAVDIVKPQYGTLLGITLVASVITAISCGLLVGPMMCGVYLTYFLVMRGERVSLDTLFRGFEYLGPAMAVGIIQLVLGLLLESPRYVIDSVSTSASQTDSTGAAVGGLALISMFLQIGTMAAQWFLNILFAFTYQLMVDRGLGAMDALQLSVEASLKNLGGLVLLTIFTGIAMLIGVAACCIGVIFVTPVVYGASALAYRQVFPDISQQAAPTWPPPGSSPYGGGPTPPYGSGPGAPY